MRPNKAYRNRYLTLEGYKATSLYVQERNRDKTFKKYKEWKAINQEASRLILEEILDNEFGFELPRSLGTLVIIGDKEARNMVDWKNSLTDSETGIRKLVYYNNHSTNGVMYGVKWTRYQGTKKKSNVHNLRLYLFRPSRNLKKQINTRIVNKQFRHWIKLDSVKYMDIKQVVQIGTEDITNPNSYRKRQLAENDNKTNSINP